MKRTTAHRRRAPLTASLFAVRGISTSYQWRPVCRLRGAADDAQSPHGITYPRVGSEPLLCDIADDAERVGLDDKRASWVGIPSTQSDCAFQWRQPMRKDSHRYVFHLRVLLSMRLLQT